MLVSRSNRHEVLVLDRQLILLLGNGHHEKIPWHAHLRLGLNRWSHHVAHVLRFIVVILMLFSNDWLVLESRRPLSANSHASSLPSQIFRWDCAHLLSLDGVAIGNYSLTHLIFRVLNRIWSQFGRQEWSDNLLDLLEMISSDFLNQLFMLNVGLDCPYRLLWRLANVTRHQDWVLPLLLWIHDRI